MALVENILSLEKEADQIVAEAHAEAKEIERSALLEAEADRRKLTEETDKKVLAFQKETEKKHEHSVAEVQKELARALTAIDQIQSAVLKRQIDRIISKFSEL